MTEPGPVDWYRVYQVLLHGEGGKYTFEQIERMTAAEIALALDRDLEKQRAPAGGTALGGPQGMSVAAYAAWWRSLTPRDKLQRAWERWW